MSLFSLALFVSLAIAAAPPALPVSGVTANLATDEQTLQNANLSTTGPGLLDFFHKRTPSAANDAAVAPLIKQLTDKEPAAHVKAAGELVALGPAAVKALRRVANSIEDADAAERAQQCLQRIEGPRGAALVGSAAKLLAVQKPRGAAAALLDYYPFADDEAVTHELDQALVQVALHDGKPEPALRALEDETAVRRAAAAAALCQAAGLTVHERVRPLLKDPKPTVRLHVALALANSHDAEVVPILIDLLGELPASQRKQAEDWLAELAGDWAFKVPEGNDDISRRLRHDLWLAWWNSVDGKQLTKEFTSRTLGDPEREQVLGFIKKLDDDLPENREQAMQALVALGPKVVPLLHQAAQQNETKTATFALKCVELIEKGHPNPLPSSAPRLLALRRPPGALATLLAYVPFAENEAVASEIADLIVTLGCPAGQPAALLVKALSDKVPARRAVAAYALCHAADASQLPAVRQLLHDADPEVRLRTAQALVALQQRDAVPVLIALLEEVPLAHAQEIEDYLWRLADEKGPQTSLTTEPASRAKCRAAWAAWWKEQGHTVVLAKVEAVSPMLGLTLVVDTAGRIAELDRAGKLRWKVEGLAGPMDAQVLPSRHVLIAEQNANRVTERDLTGKILWEKSMIPLPFVVQRLRNGNTFIGCRNMLQEVDKAGKVVASYAHPNEYLIAATRFRDGQTAYVNNQGHYSRCDAAGKEVKSFQIPFNPNFGINSAEILPNNHVLVSVQVGGKLTEYGPDGKTVWEATLPHTGVPYRLPNGHTLVSTNLRIAELDRSGKIVSEVKDLPVHPWRVSRR